MVRATKKKDEYLSQSERMGLEQDKKELEQTLAEAEGSGIGTQAEGIDRDRLRGEIKRLDVAIGERTPTKPRGPEKDKLVLEEKEIEKQLMEGMPSWYEMRKPSMNPGAVRKHMAWCERNTPAIERYRQIQRILRPMEPKSVESLRKEK